MACKYVGAAAHSLTDASAASFPSNTLRITIELSFRSSYRLGVGILPSYYLLLFAFLYDSIIHTYLYILATWTISTCTNHPPIHNSNYHYIPALYIYPCRSISEYPPGKFQLTFVGYLESFCRALVHPHYTTIFIIIYLHTTTHTQTALYRFPLHSDTGLHLHPVQNRDSRRIFFIQNPMNLESREKRAKKARTGDCRCVLLSKFKFGLPPVFSYTINVFPPKTKGCV